MKNTPAALPRRRNQSKSEEGDMLTQPDPDPPGLLSLLITLDQVGVEPVRHGAFVGLRGPLSRVPPRLWDATDAHGAALVRLLPNRPTPYRQRQRGRAA